MASDLPLATQSKKTPYEDQNQLTSHVTFCELR